MEKNKEIKKAMVLSSGGVDSTTCLGMAVEKYGKDQVIALSISYGQKHQKEIEASRKVAEYYGVEHLYLDLAPIFQYSNCSLPHILHSYANVCIKFYEIFIIFLPPPNFHIFATEKETRWHPSCYKGKPVVIIK